MAGLSPRQRDGCKKLLRIIPERQLRSLLDTVTNSQNSSVRPVEDLIQQIILYSTDAEEFLNRRKVQRDFILQYLANEGIAVPANTDKALLIERTLRFWSSEEELSHQDPLPFCNWFFQLLNSQNPAIPQDLEEWGPQHFCIDAKLNIIYSTIVGQNAGLYQGADQVNLRLLSLVREKQLILYPFVEHHRYRVVNTQKRLLAVAGTIHHQPSNCRLGYFEQVFGLICLPMGKWKIQFTDLIIGIPGISDGAEDTSSKVSWDFDVLQLRF